MQKDERIVHELLSGKKGKKYEGRNVVVIAGQIHMLPEDPRKAKKILNQLIAEHPNITPTVTFVPRQGIYILFLKK